MSSKRFPGTVPARDADHRKVYCKPDEYAAWPFNHGFWRFPGDELLVAFCRNKCAYKQRGDTAHGRVDPEGGGEYVAIRSTDEGATWPEESIRSLGRRPDLECRMLHDPGSIPRPEPVDFTSPHFAITSGFGIPPRYAQNLAYVMYSEDRGHEWQGPLRLPAARFYRLQGKHDHVVRPDGAVLLFLSASTRADALMRPVVYVSYDRGCTYTLMAFMTPEPRDYGMIYPAPVLLPDGRIIAALRCQVSGHAAWTEVVCSDDGGRTWGFLSRPNDIGVPAHLLLLKDGRVLCVYGYRIPPYGVRATISEDGGRSWGAEIIIRDDGGSWDLGYPRAVQLSDGRIAAAYYFNEAGDPIQLDGGVRHICLSIFSAD